MAEGKTQKNLMHKMPYSATGSEINAIMQCSHPSLAFYLLPWMEGLSRNSAGPP
jgi:hypothetical protein